MHSTLKIFLASSVTLDQNGLSRLDLITAKISDITSFSSSSNDPSVATPVNMLTFACENGATVAPRSLICAKGESRLGDRCGVKELVKGLQQAARVSNLFSRVPFSHATFRK
jgi:hypothetical protein